MALETVVFQQDPFSCYGGGAWNHHVGSGCFGDDEKTTRVHEAAALNLNAAEAAMNVDRDGGWDVEGGLAGVGASPPPAAPPGTVAGRRKRRRMRIVKNRDEVESQRMTHIAVERNRRKQMNEYLAVLRSLMPPSYSQRGDQASIIGGAINFVKELEQLLQSMQTHKSKPKPLQDLAAAAANNNNNDNSNNDVASPFAEFFSFPQYSTRLASVPCGGPTEPATALEDRSGGPHPQWAVADIEVTMVESHANMKIFSKKRPRQLLQLVAGLQGLRLTVLHLNVTTVDDSVLYSVSVKVEEGCHLNTVDEIAAAVHELLRRIEEGAGAFT